MVFQSLKWMRFVGLFVMVAAASSSWGWADANTSKLRRQIGAAKTEANNLTTRLTDLAKQREEAEKRKYSSDACNTCSPSRSDGGFCSLDEFRKLSQFKKRTKEDDDSFASLIENNPNSCLSLYRASPEVYETISKECREVVEQSSCGPIQKEVELKRLDRLIAESEKKLAEANERVSDLELELADAGPCDDCTGKSDGGMYAYGYGSSRQPNTGDYALGALQTLAPIGMGLIQAGMWNSSIKGYYGGYNNYLDGCIKIGVPCQGPGGPFLPGGGMFGGGLGGGLGGGMLGGGIGICAVGGMSPCNGMPGSIYGGIGGGIFGSAGIGGGLGAGGGLCVTAPCFPGGGGMGGFPGSFPGAGYCLNMDSGFGGGCMGGGYPGSGYGYGMGGCGSMGGCNPYDQYGLQLQYQAQLYRQQLAQYGYGQMSMGNYQGMQAQQQMQMAQARYYQGLQAMYAAYSMPSIGGYGYGGGGMGGGLSGGIGIGGWFGIGAGVRGGFGVGM